MLLLDGSNNFLRNYTVVTKLDRTGRRIGGVYGMLTTLSYLLRLLNPDRVVICWDGAGGSQKRRKALSSYKEGRKPPRPINQSGFELEESEEDLKKNKIWQRQKLAEYLSILPMNEITIPNIEADDVIGYLCTYFKDNQKVIVSSDKDFYQLLDQKTIIYRPVKKEYITAKTVLDAHGIHPNNFAIARAMVGDTSDNIKGIKGVGLKSVVKCFPFLGSHTSVSVQDIMEFSTEQSQQKKGKKYEKFLSSKDVIMENFSIMQLKDPIISSDSIIRIKQAVAVDKGFNGTEFRKKLLDDGITEVGERFIQQFRILSVRNNNNGIS